MIVNLLQFPWYGDTEFQIEFPPSWEVNVCAMPGQDAPALGEAGIRAAFQNPIGTPRIAELARGKKEVAITFDDMSRPTKIAELVPYLLEELREGGIKDENIRFISAVGAHGAMKLMDFVKKLGPETVQQFPVYNHNPYENCTYLGDTSNGTPVSINSEFVYCDLKICIGAILPHSMMGYGGGTKSVLPGVAHIDTFTSNHSHLRGGTPGVDKGNQELWGCVDDNLIRLDSEEAARMARLDVIVNAVVNLRRDTIGLFVGDPVAAHRKGVEFGRTVYATEVPVEADVVIANAYSKANEGLLMVRTGNNLLKKEGGDLVMLCNIPEGQICHYLLRSFGKTIGGRLWKPRTELPPRVQRMIMLGTYVDKAGLDWMGPPDQITMAYDWEGVLGLLKEKYGDRARVTVVPDATIQYFPALQEAG